MAGISCAQHQLELDSRIVMLVLVLVLVLILRACCC
jgi:hypothetical protein